MSFSIEDLAKRIEKDGREHISIAYVPTQIVAEYIRHFLSRIPPLAESPSKVREFQAALAVPFSLMTIIVVMQCPIGKAIQKNG